MPAWIAGIQGIREILNSVGTALTRRKQLQFGTGFSAADDGTRTVVTLGNPSASYAAALAPLLRGVGLTVDSTDKLRTRRRPRRIQEADYFLSGNAASGSIGKLGWNLLGVGTPAVTRNTIATGIASASKLSLTTSAASGDESYLVLGETASRTVVAAGDVITLQCNVNQNSDLASKRFFFGMLGTFADEPSAATDALGIYYDSAVSPNYQLIARIGGVGSPVVTATAVPSNTNELLSITQLTAGSFNFRSGNTSLGTISSGVPTANMNLGFRIETLTTAAKTVRIGYFGLNGDLTGSLDDDTFLES